MHCLRAIHMRLSRISVNREISRVISLSICLTATEIGPRGLLECSFALIAVCLLRFFHKFCKLRLLFDGSLPRCCQDRFLAYFHLVLLVCLSLLAMPLRHPRNSLESSLSMASSSSSSVSSTVTACASISPKFLA